MKHFWIYFTRFVFLSWTVFLLLVAFWLLYPYKVSSIKEPIAILNEYNEIAIGDAIIMKIELTKPNEIRPKGTVFITCDSGNLVTLLGNPQNLPVGKYTVVNDRYILPSKVSVGDKCKFHFKNSYQVNPIREITKEWVSEEFTVIGE